MKMRQFAAAVGVAATLVLAAGCSSTDDSDHEDHSSGSAASTTTAAATSASAAAIAPPGDGWLANSLVLVVDPAVDSATKAAVIENGQTRLANLDAMTAALANYGQINWYVAPPTVEGETATADVTIMSPRGNAPPTPYTWVFMDNTWKISDASACQLLAMGQAPCV